ncbi:MAG: hypothetical protein WDM77_05065 [Steroidobacteraceae bacterium]
MEREAYEERRAIMIIEGMDALTAARDAADCASLVLHHWTECGAVHRFT